MDSLRDLAVEFRGLAETPGNDPIRCSRMHFREWADVLDRCCQPPARPAARRMSWHRRFGRLMWVPGLFPLFIAWTFTDPDDPLADALTALHGVYTSLQLVAGYWLMMG